MNWQDMEASAPIDEVLGAARDDGLVEVAVVGRRASGEIVVLGSHPNGDAVIGLLHRGVHWLTAREQLNDNGA
jgi:hypothetical protein